MKDINTERVKNNLVELSTEQLSGKIGKMEKTDIDFLNTDFWKDIYEFTPIYVNTIIPGFPVAKIARISIDRDIIKIVVVAWDENKPETLAGVGHSYSGRIIRIAEITRMYMMFDYTKGYDWIEVPVEDSYFNQGLFVKDTDRGVMECIKNVSSDGWIKCYNTLNIKLHAARLELYAYVGVLKHLVADCNGEYIGRFFYSMYDHTYNKCLSIKHEGNMLHMRVQGFLVPNENFNYTSDLGITYQCTLNKDCIKWLDIIDEEVAAGGNVDERGRFILQKIDTTGSKDKTYVLELKGDSIITSNEACIETVDIDTLIIKADKPCKFELFSGGQQPCIGRSTNTGLSYGRWSRDSSCSLKKIILENIHLYLESKVTNFSLGAYNDENYPEIEMKGESSVIGCPEMGGTRILVHKARHPDDSTKYSELPEYVIIRPEQKEDDLMSEELLSIKEKIASINPVMADKVNLFTSYSLATNGFELLKLKPDLDISSLLDKPTINASDHTIVCCTVLGLPVSLAKHGEFNFELAKIQELLKQYEEYDDNDENLLHRICKIVRRIYSNKDFKQLSAWDKRIIYEMIPAYQFEFKGTIEESVEKFYNLSI